MSFYVKEQNHNCNSTIQTINMYRISPRYEEIWNIFPSPRPQAEGAEIYSIFPSILEISYLSHSIFPSIFYTRSFWTNNEKLSNFLINYKIRAFFTPILSNFGFFCRFFFTPWFLKQLSNFPINNSKIVILLHRKKALPANEANFWGHLILFFQKNEYFSFVLKVNRKKVRYDHIRA